MGTSTYPGSLKKYYFVANGSKEPFVVSYRIYKELMHADGTHPLRISKPLLEQLKANNILSTKRYIFDGIISRFIVLPLGNSIARFRPICRLINAALPFFAVLLLAVSVFLKQRYSHSGIGDFNILLYSLLAILSLAAHEYAHLISGISYGYKFTELGLLLLGILPVGAYVSHLEKKNVPRLAIIQFSLAGIEANTLLAAVFVLLSVIPSSLDTTLFAAAYINVSLAVLNLLPASGLDGESAFSALLGFDSISKYSKLFFRNKKFRRSILRAGVPGYICAVIFSINLLSSVLVGLFVICDLICICLIVF